MAFQCILDKFQNDKKIFVSNLFYHFLFAVSLGNRAPKMSEKFRLDRKIGFQNTFYTKCTNVIIDSIGPSIILRSIFHISMESQPQNPEFRINPENFHPLRTCCTTFLDRISRMFILCPSVHMAAIDNKYSKNQHAIFTWVKVQNFQNP